mmetsp:Transcript_484/g.1866  ORF Transcript_484/g.1866 Transcript_484/m.1866 type:complete len:233 (+) Transcript_484:128-826(+)
MVVTEEVRPRSVAAVVHPAGRGSPRSRNGGEAADRCAIVVVVVRLLGPSAPRPATMIIIIRNEVDAPEVEAARVVREEAVPAEARLQDVVDEVGRAELPGERRRERVARPFGDVSPHDGAAERQGLVRAVGEVGRVDEAVARCAEPVRARRQHHERRDAHHEERGGQRDGEAGVGHLSRSCEAVDQAVRRVDERDQMVRHCGGDEEDQRAEADEERRRADDDERRLSGIFVD